MTLKIPTTVNTCLARLTANGYEAYIVGGCVRDSLLGRDPADWDLCTSALPEEITACFPDCRVLPTGIAHGTVTVLPDKGSALGVEITTFRSDGDYPDHRRPEDVRFTTSIREDLARRDFTVNAMAYHPDTGLMDFYGGLTDLEARVLRCVGEPEQRFAEDALRILRLFRFAAKLNFIPETRTLQAAKLLRQDLVYISAERIASELSGLLCCNAPGNTLKAMCDTGALQTILPEFAAAMGFEQHSVYHNRTVDLHTFAAVDAVEPVLILRLTMLLHDIAKPLCFRLDSNGQGHFKGHDTMGANMAKEILTRMRFDNATIRQVSTLIAYHDYTIALRPVPIKKLLSRLGEPTLRLLLQVKIADTLAKEPPMMEARLKSLLSAQAMLEDILAQNPCVTREQLAINGDDIRLLGYAGRQISQELARLLAMVIEDRLPNQRQALLEEAAKPK